MVSETKISVISITEGRRMSQADETTRGDNRKPPKVSRNGAVD